jgi:argininosuccinate lyase
MKSALTFQRAAWLLGAALVFAQNAAQACPGCKQVEGAPLSGASAAFGWDIGFMLVMIGSLLGSLSFIIYKSCQALAERDCYLENEALLAGDAV